MALKMSPEEKVYLDKLVAISGKDINTIRDVLRSILILFSVEAYAGEEEVTIPYIGKFRFYLLDKYLPSKGSYTDVSLEVDPCISLVEELVAICNGDSTPTEEFFKKNVFTSMKDILEIEESEFKGGFKEGTLTERLERLDKADKLDFIKNEGL